MSLRKIVRKGSRLGRWGAAAFFPAALTGLTRTAYADQLYVPAPVSLSQTGLTITSIGGGLNQWDTSLNVTNTSANPIYDVIFRSSISKSATTAAPTITIRFGTIPCRSGC